MYLARYAKDVQIVVRRDSLRDTMSRYLVDQIDQTPNIRLRPRTELERVEGAGHVERAVLTLDDGTSQVEAIDAVFIFIGAKPRSAWLPADVLRDAKGFVITGRDLPWTRATRGSGRNAVSRWPSSRVCPGCSRLATSAPVP